MIHILLVDDEEDYTEELAEAFRRECSDDYSITEAKDASSALKILAENEIDVVLLDLAIPNVLNEDVTKKRKGIELLKEIKSKLPNICVIMLSSFKDLDDVVLAMKAGAFDYKYKFTTDFSQIVQSIEKGTA